jgi:hypothetical protein
MKLFSKQSTSPIYHCGQSSSIRKESLLPSPKLVWSPTLSHRIPSCTPTFSSIEHLPPPTHTHIQVCKSQTINSLHTNSLMPRYSCQLFSGVTSQHYIHLYPQPKNTNKKAAIIFNSVRHLNIWTVVQYIPNPWPVFLKWTFSFTRQTQGSYLTTKQCISNRNCQDIFSYLSLPVFVIPPSNS